MMMKMFRRISNLLLTAVFSMTCSIFAIAQPGTGVIDIQEDIKRLAADPALAEGVVSICARTGDGRIVADVNRMQMMVPASNMKLITTGAALNELGADYRFETAIGYDGSITDGTLDGNLYIIGGGDPTLGSKDSIAVTLESVFKEWESMIRKAGIRRITGRIIGDGRYFDGMMEEPTWLWNDVGVYYGAGTTGLMFYENMQSFSVNGGAEPGDPVKISPSYPETPWMEFRYDCTTGEKGTGDRLYMYTSDLAPIAVVRGTFGVDRGSKRVDCSNKYPEYTCAYYFHDFLKKKGIRCDGGTGDFRLDRAWEPCGEVQLLGRTYSPELSRIVFETNHASNNVFAETLMRSLGKVRTGSATYDSSYVAMEEALKILKVNTSKGIHIQDGSGLSRQNLVSPDFMCRFLEAMMDSGHFEEYLASLPSPGKDGTMFYNMKSYPASMKSRIMVKSGSMNGVRCYSGYILPSGWSAADIDDMPEDALDGIIIFSIMTNNCTSPTWKVRPLLDKMMAVLAGAN